MEIGWGNLGSQIGAGSVGVLLATLFFLIFFRVYNARHQDKAIKERTDQFISLASHYLLTPITVIQAAIIRLQEEQSLDVQGREHMYEAIVRGQNRLMILAEQFLLVSKIDQHDLRVHLAVADINSIISDAITTIHPFAQEKGVTITFDGGPTAFQQTRLDARHMKQAVIAVLDNAVKFSTANTGVEIKTEVEGGIFAIHITDHGVGMTDLVVKRLTEKFFRGNSIYSFDYEGIGLGLYVASAILGQHQGIIHFTSKPGEGTTATIEFPNL